MSMVHETDDHCLFHNYSGGMYGGGCIKEWLDNTLADFFSKQPERKHKFRTVISEHTFDGRDQR